MARPVKVEMAMFATRSCDSGLHDLVFHAAKELRRESGTGRGMYFRDQTETLRGIQVKGLSPS